MKLGTKIIMILSIIIALISGIKYVTGLQDKIAIANANLNTLNNAISLQEAAIKLLKEDQDKIKKINSDIAKKSKQYQKDINKLRDRFSTTSTGKPRDLGKDAIRNTSAIEKAVNLGTKHATRCLEIASGSPLTKEEKDATTIQTINKECPSLANPNYIGTDN